MLKSVKNDLYWYGENGEKTAGPAPGITGDYTGLRGDCSGLRGYCSGWLTGDCTGLYGNLDGLYGNLDKCSFNRGQAIDINTLVDPNDSSRSRFTV